MAMMAMAVILQCKSAINYLVGNPGGNIHYNYKFPWWTRKKSLLSENNMEQKGYFASHL